jgi:mRNA-degrading endonuclease RelE of RelBE toxin-antitoxin system
MPGWTLTFASTYVADLRALPIFDRARIQAAVATSLPAEPDRPARHRRALKAPVSWCPEATWQLRVGNYRVLYRLEGDAVEVLRVRLKARRTTEEMGSK